MGGRKKLADNFFPLITPFKGGCSASRHFKIESQFFIFYLLFSIEKHYCWMQLAGSQATKTTVSDATFPLAGQFAQCKVGGGLF